MMILGLDGADDPSDDEAARAAAFAEDPEDEGAVIPAEEGEAQASNHTSEEDGDA